MSIYCFDRNHEVCNNQKTLTLEVRVYVWHVSSSVMELSVSLSTPALSLVN
jgi:hypothetical protein